MLITLFKPLRPDPVEVVVRVVAEGDHGLGAGDARDLGELLGDYLRKPLELRNAHQDDRSYQDPRLPLILNTERHRARESIVFLAPLVPDGAYPDAGLGGLVELA